MIELQCFDSAGNTIQRFCQWDVNQEIYMVLEGFDLTNAPEVHFCNKEDDVAIIVNTTVSGNTIRASVPNQLLQESSILYAYVYLQDTNTSLQRSVAYTKIPVHKRPKPADYIHIGHNCIGYIISDLNMPYIPLPFATNAKAWGYGTNGNITYSFKGDSYISNGTNYSMNVTILGNGIVNGLPQLTSGTVLITVGI